MTRSSNKVARCTNGDRSLWFSRQRSRNSEAGRSNIRNGNAFRATSTVGKKPTLSSNCGVRKMTKTRQSSSDTGPRIIAGGSEAQIEACSRARGERILYRIVSIASCSAT